MLKNYLVVALRNLRRQKGYAFINVVGLAVGLACCLLILLLVRHEWSYDDFHANADRLHRVVIQETAPDGAVEYHDKIQPSVADELQATFPAVERVTQFVGGTVLLRRGTDPLEANAYLADSTLFEIFSFPFLAGDPATALDEPDGVVLTAETAARYFGDTAPSEVMGQAVTIESSGERFDAVVTGVTEDVPSNSSLFFDLVLPFRLYQNGTLYLGGNDWGGRTSLYVLLPPNTDAAAFEASLPPFTATALGERAEARREAGYVAADEDAFRLVLQPLPAVHLQPELGVSYERPPYNPTYGVILGGIALLVLLIACINFVTLSLGRSTRRAKEVGMRKAIGAGRAQVAGQFWGESLLLTAVAFTLGLGLARLALPFFNTLTEQELSFGVLGTWEMLLAVLGLLVLVGLVAGGYPALVLSRFQPATVLKGQHAGPQRSLLARALVVVQYTIAVAMIVGTLGMARQLDFLLTKDLGFEGDQVVVVHTGAVGTDASVQALDVFRTEALPHPSVQNIVRTGYAFTYSGDTNGWQGPDGTNYEAHMIGADYDFVEVLGMEVVAGRDFDPRFPADSTQSVLVNEAFVRTYRLADPVGTRLDGFDSFFEEAPTIVGVVEDFNFRSLHEAVPPAVINMSPDYYGGMRAMLVKIGAADVPGALAQLEQTWTGLFPETPFEYTFLDEDMDRLYATERRWSRIVLVAAGFAVGIACLGLFGLATLSAARRTKELGVRKVLGASVPRLVGLVVREFVVLVGLAVVVAWPLAWFGMRRWLDGFAYRTDLGLDLFLGAGLATLVIAVLTVGYHALRAASTDPVKALRYE
jgi:putative ABC transport system permease protein